MALYQVKKNKKWIIKALDRGTKRTIAWVVGDRDTATFQRLYDKVRYIQSCIFYTDNWNVFSSIWPEDHHVIGKAHMITIERDNSNTRHHLGRMTKRTKVVSKSEEMLDMTMKIWSNLIQHDVFFSFQMRDLNKYSLFFWGLTSIFQWD